MDGNSKTVLVLGATGQQGGSVALALHSAGWRVRALVRDPGSSKALTLRDSHIEVVQGDFSDRASLRAAMAGVYGVFSVQPSSGQGALYGVSDEDEIRYGCTVADVAVECGVSHLIYSSANAAGPEPSGMGHFDSKYQIEEHIRALPINSTIIRPSAFMEMLLMPGFGLDQGYFEFFMRPDQAMQFIAVADIGVIAAAIFADPIRYCRQTLEIAGDAVTGRDLAAYFSAEAGRPIVYRRFTDAALARNPFLAGLTRLVEDGRLAGRADLQALRALHPGLLSFRAWLSGPGKVAFMAALQASGAWNYGHG